MHLSQLHRETEQFSRADFLTELWNLTEEHEHPIVIENLALTISSKYLKLVRSGYTRELAHVSTIIAVKYELDTEGYESVKIAASTLSNAYVYELERDVLRCIEFKFELPPFLKYLYGLFEQLEIDRTMNSDFRELLRDIVVYEINLPPKILLWICIWLYKQKRLEAIKRARVYRLYLLFESLAWENEIPLSDCVEQYNLFYVKTQ